MSFHRVDSMSSANCNPDQLRLLLVDQIPDELQAELAEHLDACAECRRTLETLAGDQAWWTEVEGCFQSHEEAVQLGIETRDYGEMLDEETAISPDFIVDYLEPTDRLDSLGRLGEYEILQLIGCGGMGVVLKGFQHQLGRFVAVKVMSPSLAASGAARQRFIREARAAAAIVHPNVMPIHSVCTTSRLPYLVMPFLACESLQQRIDRQGFLDVAEILRIGLQVAQGLSASHAQGLVHRDVKPANILLEKGVDRVMLTDFGLARAADDSSLTRTGTVTGTPQYMSPEQSAGEALDCRSDLFSLGSVLYAMCTGRSPFRAETALAVLRRISDTQARPIREINPNIPEWLEQIVARLHAKHPDHRFQSAAELLDLLEQCLAYVQQPATKSLPRVMCPTTAAPVAIPINLYKQRSYSARILALTGCAILFAACALILTWQPDKLRQDSQIGKNHDPQNISVAETTLASPTVSQRQDGQDAAAPETVYSILNRPTRRNPPPDPQPFDPSALPAVLTWNFQGKCPNFLRDWGGRQADSAVPLESGLRVVRSPMADASEIGVAFQLNADLSDDFEITLEFRDFESTPHSASWRVPRIDISGHVFSATDPDTLSHVLGINHRRELDGSLKVSAVQGDKSPTGGIRYKSVAMPIERDSGRLRLVRQGQMMFYQAAPLDAEQWTTIVCYPVNPGLFKSIVVGLRADDPEDSGEAILTNVTIRAQAMQAE